MTRMTLISLALACVATNTSAGDAGSADYWSGTYLGAHFGAGAGTINQTFSDELVSIQKSFPNPVSTSNATGSGQRQGDITGSNLDLFVGYNVHPNDSKFVLGGQFEGTLFNNTTMKARGIRNVTTTTISKSGSTINSNSLSNATAVSELSTNLQSMFSFIGRAGFLAKPNTLIYALVGATEGNFFTVDTSNNTAGGSTATENKRSQWQLGLTAGGGVEYKLSEHWSLLGEYRYLHFNFNQNGSLSSTTKNTNQLTHAPSSETSSISSQNTHSNFNFNLGQIGIVYRV